MPTATRETAADHKELLLREAAHRKDVAESKRKRDNPTAKERAEQDKELFSRYIDNHIGVKFLWNQPKKQRQEQVALVMRRATRRVAAYVEGVVADADTLHHRGDPTGVEVLGELLDEALILTLNITEDDVRKARGRVEGRIAADEAFWKREQEARAARNV